jgi:CheY-like chemotaxis protein
MTAKKKILIADDDPRNRTLLQTLLCFEGYDVRCVDSGQAALLELTVEPADLILLDLMMPGMDGFEVVRRLRSNPGTSRIPLVAVTALDDNSSQARLNSAGVMDIITKPIDRWRLKSCVDRILGGSP